MGMIVVSDNEGDRVEVGEDRIDLVAFLSNYCSDDYTEVVLHWWDEGAGGPLNLDNGKEGVTDTWEIVPDEEYNEQLEQEVTVSS